MTKLTLVAGKGVRFLRAHGLRATCKAALRRLGASQPATGKAAGGGALPYRFAYEPITYRHRSAAAAEPARPASVNWVIPNFYGSSGGHRTIFRLTRALEDAGHEVRFHLFGETHYVSDSEATEVMRRHYFPLKAAVHLGVTQMPPSDICVASSWETAYAVRDFDACRRKVYFVQDYEPSFYPASAEMVLAENTYGFGFDCICAGRWLAEKMRGYGNRAESFDLAYDPAVYSPGAGGYGKNRVVFYARHQTRRRGTELGLLSLALLKRSRPETEVVIFGSDDLPYRLPFDYTPAGLLSEGELAELYRGAAVGLSISLTNYSLVPQEMLACGLPVVEMDMPSVRAAYPHGGAALRLAAPNPSAIAGALSEALSLPDAEARRAREEAARLVAHLSWARAETALLDFLETDGGRDAERPKRA
ncbi:MAG TPA: glycosyltransferase family 4 protein [Pyrinomonadaceae bacterium]|jgi:glycosyltransferase involved in cell wall biosynthesis